MADPEGVGFFFAYFFMFGALPKTWLFLFLILALFVNNQAKRLHMKILLFALLMITNYPALAQQEQKVDIIEEVSTHLKEASIKELSQYFDVTVELTIQERENAYSKAQAEIILKNFFMKYPPKSFKVIHRGASEKGGKYLIGLLTAENGTSFRTSVIIIEKNEQFYVQQIRFE
jgi:hypothetical protein